MKDASAIRHMKSRALRGDLLAAFQLYEIHNTATATPDDQITAQSYLQQCQDTLLSTQKIISLTSLQFDDFRKFQSANIEFDPKLTVLFGENGTGKTTILDAIIKHLDWLAGNIEKQNDSGPRINDEYDIRIGSDGHTSISARFMLAKKTVVNATLAQSTKGTTHRSRSALTEIRTTANMLRTANAQKTLNLPLFAYYTAERSSQRPQYTYGPDALKNIQTPGRFEAYKDAFASNRPLLDFVQWVLYLDNHTLASAQTSTASLPPNLNHTLVATLHHRVETLQNAPASSESLAELQVLRTTLKELQALQPISSIHPEHDTLSIHWLTTFLQTLISGVEMAQVERSSGFAQVQIILDGIALNINQLSHGQRALLALGGDIARRMMLLNPHMKNPLDTSGIIVIDEIELHLHPKWQQRIVQSLQQTFPNIQLVIATHSPQVLSAVDRRQIRHIKLGENGSPVIETPEWQTMGASSEHVLSLAMDTASQVEDLQVVEKLRHLELLIAEGQVNSPALQSLYESLQQHFGNDHPIMLNIEGNLQFARLKHGFSTKNK